MQLSLLFLGTALFSMLLPLGAIKLWQWSRDVRKIRSPLKVQMLRAPGTSLQSKVEDRTDTMMLLYAWAAGLPIVAVMSISGGLRFDIAVSPAVASRAMGMGALTGIVFTGGLILWARRTTNYLLGLRGERVVAQALQELVRQGCYVFHDLQPEKTWNIDHIVVAPESVLVIETKTRRIYGARDGKTAHEVTFDGARLHYPSGTDVHGLQQAERNAGWVRDYLSKALGEPVRVEPVLALPGWWVHRKGRGRVHVVNPKEMRALVRARGTRGITAGEEKRMKQIAFALAERCRDEEF